MANITMGNVITKDSDYNVAVKQVNKYVEMLGNIVSELRNTLPCDDKKKINGTCGGITDTYCQQHHEIYQRVGWLRKNTIARITARIPNIDSIAGVYPGDIELQFAKIDVLVPEALAPIEKITSKYAKDFTAGITIVKCF
jgi:hypothetical protein